MENDLIPVTSQKRCQSRISIAAEKNDRSILFGQWKPRVHILWLQKTVVVSLWETAVFRCASHQRRKQNHLAIRWWIVAVATTVRYLGFGSPLVPALPGSTFLLFCRCQYCCEPFPDWPIAPTDITSKQTDFLLQIFAFLLCSCSTRRELLP